MTHKSPRPYSGHRIDRRERIGQAWSQVTCASDRAPERTYRFNALGFRGPEFDPESRFMVFVFGEDDAFGVGVDFEETWPYLVALREAAHRGVDPADMCVMNFAEGESSNSGIARMVVTQCACVVPDLVLINFAEHERAEGYADGSTFPIGPWLRAEATDHAARPEPPAAGQFARALAFLRYCDHDQGVFQSTRDILLVQATLQDHGIDAVAIAREPEELQRADLRTDPALGPLIDLIDESFFARHISPLTLVDRIDWRDDGQHFGPSTHEAIAKRVIEHLAARHCVR